MTAGNDGERRMYMRVNREYEREINLRDLFFDLLYRWRSLLIAALLGAVLLTGFQFCHMEIAHRQGRQTKAERKYEIKLESHRNSIRNARNSVETYARLIEEKQDYLDQSLYMKLDSQNEWMAYKQYYIKVDPSVLDAFPKDMQEDPADYVASVYTSTLKADLNAEEMEALLGTGRSEFIDELVDIYADNTTNTVTLEIVGASEEAVRAQMAYFDERLWAVSRPQALKIGEHTLTLMAEDTLLRMDDELSDKKDEINQKLIELQESLTEQRETLIALEGKKEPSAPGKRPWRDGLIGFVLGGLLLAGIYAAKYAMGGRLHTGNELVEHYGIPVFGEYWKSRARRPGRGLDRLFESWERRRGDADDEAVLAGIAALLREKYAGGKVLLVGTVAEEKLRSLAERLRDELEDGVALDVRAGFPADASAVSAAGNADAVLLVEEKHRSDTRAIEREIEILAIGSANVGGCILL